MSLLGILFRQKNVVIGAKPATATTAAGAIVEEFKDSLVRTWGAATSKGIVVDASVSEDHVSSCEPTDNPVEGGAKITDHVQLNPKQLTVEGVISDSPLGFAVIGNIQNIARAVATVFGNSVRSIDAYNELVELQESRIPFTVVTGLKRYENMILMNLTVPRTVQTGRAIHFKAVMREIVIVNSEVTPNSALGSGVRNVAGKTKDNGQKVTSPVPADSGISNNESYAHEWFRSRLPNFGR